ncbi:CG6136 [Drosophila busckii]|uniref:CG6136 n=1 Tax=Drosophila busckii TaxID=30019 RepID=A0A0M4EE83_DROBS|nr:CG6136 [Drosophila busckii]
MRDQLENVDFNNFNQQLNGMESKLQETDECNYRLAAQIDKLKRLLRINQIVVNKLQDNDKSIESMVDNEHETEQHAQVMQRVTEIEKKLLATMNLFNALKTQSNNCKDRARSSNAVLPEKLSALGGKLISIGNELLEVRRDKAAMECLANRLHSWPCKEPKSTTWTTCKTAVQNNMLCKLTLQEINTIVEPTKNIAQHRKLIQRVEQLLARSEHLNINSENFTKVRILSKVVLRALIKRKQLYELFTVNAKCKQTMAISNPYI